MPPPIGARRGDISLSMSREYKKVKPKGKLSEIIDFHMNGRNRYMVINQQRAGSRQKLNSSALSNSRNPAKFRNPLLNKYEDDGDDDYERKHYVFEDDDDDEKANGDGANGGKGKTGKKKKRLAKTLKNKDGLNGTNNDKENNKNGTDDNNNNNNNDNNNQNEDKVDETAKMIEDLLKDKKNENGNDGGGGGGGDDNGDEADRKRKHDASVGVSEEEKKQFFKEKNIQVNLSTKDVDDAEKITKKPKKKGGLKNEMTMTDKELKSISTQTPRDLYLEFENDRLSRARNPNEYINQLIDDVQKISHDVARERERTGPGGGVRPHSMDSKYKDRRGSIWNRESSLIGGVGDGFNNSRRDSQVDGNDPLGSRRDSLASNKDGRRSRRKGKPTNSLGLTMEGKNGINMAIIKDVIHESDLEYSEDGSQLPTEKREAVLLRKNYQNLEDLIQHLMAQPDADSDPNYLKLAKLNRLKVLMEMSMKMVGRKYNDIGNEERGNLELEANRYHSTYPLPGEEIPLEEIDEKGVKRTRMPIKVVSDEGAAKIDVNAQYLIDPADFLKIYTSKLINHAQDSTGLVFDNITVTIPAAYGAQQREAIKNSVNQGIEREDAKILTRPVAAAVILNNQRIANGEQDFVSGEMFKLVFDITEASLDASVIKITDSKDFQVISNVGDASFGLHDIDERIVEHIITEKAHRHLASSSSVESAHDVATVNAYSHLIKSIKLHVAEEGAVNVDLANMTYLSEQQQKKQASNKRTRPQDELTIDKVKIARSLCKDIYDWSLAHIDKAIHQADVNERDVDEIIIIGGPEKMPGFYECLRNAYPHKRITFVPEHDLAVGAAIVGRKLKYQQIKVTEVLCRSIGIGLYTGVITYLLFRNSSLPCVGGCVYSTLVDDQETMVLDVYEGERPHVKFCRYLGEVTILGLPKGEAGRVKCEVYLRMNNEGLLEVSAKELNSGVKLETVIDANPDQFDASDDPTGLNETELSPIEAERYKKPDYDLVYELESLDAYLEQLGESYRSHKMAKYMLDKIFDTKEWLYKNRRKLTANECKSIRRAIDKYLKNLKSIKY